jgi:hypothetical protein
MLYDVVQKLNILNILNIYTSFFIIHKTYKIKYYFNDRNETYKYKNIVFVLIYFKHSHIIFRYTLCHLYK